MYGTREREMKKFWRPLPVSILFWFQQWTPLPISLNSSQTKKYYKKLRQKLTTNTKYGKENHVGLVMTWKLMFFHGFVLGGSGKGMKLVGIGVMIGTDLVRGR